MTDYYNILGVSNDATEQEIKKAYRKLSLQNHPDRNPGNIKEANEKISKINDAYETLGDSEKRKMYDMKKNMGNVPFSPGFSHFPPGFPFGPGGIRVNHGRGGIPPDINDVFSHFFDNMNGSPMGTGMAGNPSIRIFHNGRPVNMQRPTKPPPIIKKVPITLEQAYIGFDIKLEVERKTYSNGSEIIENETIPVNVPRGIEDEETIILTDMGNHSPHNMKGDIHITISVEKHEIFTRKGLDLVCKKSISLKDALCHFSIEIPHLSGKMLRLSNQNQTTIVTPGFKKEIPEYGMTRNDETGNLVLEFDVIFPNSLSDEQKKVLSDVL